MKEDNNIPEPEIFTSEIEDTIDDLFKPAKKIEIDPLTQEVKEIDQEQEVLPVEFELEEGDKTPEQTEPEIEAAGGPESLTPKEQPETLLELDLELEVDEAAAGEPEEAAAEAEKTETPDGVGAKLEQLRQQIFTIEWEVTEPQIHQTLSLISSLIAAPEISGRPQARSMVELMEKVLRNIQYHPENVPATAPSVLKKTAEYLLDLLTAKDSSPDTGGTLLQDLKALVEKPRKEEEETGREQTPVPDEKAEKADEREESAPAAELPPVEVPVGAAKEKTTATEAAERADNLLSDQGRRLLKAHLAELKRYINRIEALEKLLSKTPGMDKLYSFQHDIRLGLEGQLAELSRFFFQQVELDLPEKVPTKPENEDNSKKASARSAWQEILTVSVDGVEVGFPAEQAVYVSGPPWHSRSAIKKASTLSLKKLKPWPWSKLKGLFQGRLASLEDSVLSSMQFPVVHQIGGQDLPVPSGFTVILLFDGQNGAALLTEEKPIRIEIPGDAEWTQIQAEGFEAEVKTHGNRIKVATARSLNQV